MNDGFLKSARIFNENKLPPLEVIPNSKKEEIAIRLVQSSHSSDFITIGTNPSKWHIQIFYKDDRRDDANWDELESIFLSGQKRELVIFVSDMYEYNNEIREVLRKLHALKNEVILFQLTGRNELD